MTRFLTTDLSALCEQLVTAIKSSTEQIVASVKPAHPDNQLIAAMKSCTEQIVVSVKPALSTITEAQKDNQLIATIKSCTEQIVASVKPAQPTVAEAQPDFSAIREQILGEPLFHKSFANMSSLPLANAAVLFPIVNGGIDNDDDPWDPRTSAKSKRNKYKTDPSEIVPSFKLITLGSGTVFRAAVLRGYDERDKKYLFIEGAKAHSAVQALQKLFNQTNMMLDLVKDARIPSSAGEVRCGTADVGYYYKPA